MSLVNILKNIQEDSDQLNEFLKFCLIFIVYGKIKVDEDEEAIEHFNKET
jgi:hypothetical protein